MATPTPMTPKEFAAGVAWVVLQIIGKDKDEAELQDAFDEALQLMFRCEAGDEEAAKTVMAAGHNFQATVKIHLEMMERRRPPQ